MDTRLDDTPVVEWVIRDIIKYTGIMGRGGNFGSSK